MSLTGAASGPPTKSGVSLVDLSAGYVATVAILAGLRRAERDGIGCDCDFSLFETALHQLCYVATWAATAGYVPERLDDSAHPSIVPFQSFATADGWIVVACPKEKFWRSLCAVLGRDDLLGDPRFADFAGRLRHREEIVTAIADELGSRPAREWLEALGEAGVPCAPVNDVAEALAEQQAGARGAVVDIEHPRFGVVRQVASPLRVDGATRTYRRAPARDEHREDVLRRVCGYDDETIRERAAAGAFGDDP
jgi:crotonobetainyl-CoA:carnitine CoA-transferase CaiB-like acyl-CoA transferase